MNDNNTESKASYDGIALLSVAEAARRCGVGKTLLYRWLASGVLRSVKLSGRRLVDASSVRELQAKCRDGLGGER